MNKKRKVMDNEDRLMALLALTSQELPAKNGNSSFQHFDGAEFEQLTEEQQQAFYDALDSDGEAFEDLIIASRVKAKSDETGSSLREKLKSLLWLFDGQGFTPARGFALASVAAIVLVGVIALPTLLSNSLSEQVSQSYVEVRLNRDSASLSLILPWQREPIGLGFTPSAQSASDQSLAFAQGLIAGANRLGLDIDPELANNIRLDPNDSTLSDYRALGRWNIVLWAAAQNLDQQVNQFWQHQHVINRHFIETFSQPENGSPLVISHLRNIDQIIDDLSKAVELPRNARRLSNELILFREQLAPSSLESFQ